MYVHPLATAGFSVTILHMNTANNKMLSMPIQLRVSKIVTLFVKWAVIEDVDDLILTGDCLCQAQL